MWLSRAFLLLICLSVAACGFSPLYGGTQSSRNPGPLMAQTKVSSIKNREGQLLRNQLVQRLTPRGEPAQPLYVLDVSRRESIVDLGIQRDSRATFSRLDESAQFELRSVETGKIVFRGVSQSSVSFNVVESPYAEYSAETDARHRALQQISDDIFLQLGTYFKTVPFRSF